MAKLKNNQRVKILKALRSRKLMEELGLGAERIIKKRTRGSKDVDGNPFDDYNKSYLQKRKRKGISNPEKVTLQFSRIQTMLNSIDHDIANNLESVKLYFEDKDKEQLAIYHNEVGAGKGRKIREFWGIKLKSEKDQLARKGFKILKDIFRRLK